MAALAAERSRIALRLRQDASALSYHQKRRFAA